MGLTAFVDVTYVHSWFLSTPPIQLSLVMKPRKLRRFIQNSALYQGLDQSFLFILICMALLVSCKGLDVSLRQRLVCRQALHSRCDLCMILHMIEVDRRMWQWAVWIIWIKPFSSLSLVVQKLYKLKLKPVQ